MQTLPIAKLLDYTTGYSLNKSGGTRTIVVPQASKVAALGMVKVTGGQLLPKQGVSYDLSNGKRSVNAVSNGKYKITANDGDLHFCVGDKPGNPHVPCEIQAAEGQQDTYNSHIGDTCVVTGFFRCGQKGVILIYVPHRALAAPAAGGVGGSAGRASRLPGAAGRADATSPAAPVSPPSISSTLPIPAARRGSDSSEPPPLPRGA